MASKLPSEDAEECRADTELLLDAGAEIDATANVYGGGATTLGLAATSVHPERAGVQEALLQTLLDHGAVIDQPRSAGNNDPLYWVPRKWSPKSCNISR